ncbi:MAG: TetR/AcrR family transcriptional regulator [Treponema sp.]|nr:TetR/AcrR family transcriptional regulator [Treponema sp.]
MEVKNPVRESIISITIDLINEYEGELEKINSRLIAQRAGVSLGLINYHFGSKKKLINLSVERIINNIVLHFKPRKNKKPTLSEVAIEVFEFLFSNKAIARISILSDMENYQENSNSVFSQKGFSLFMPKNLNKKEKALLSFILCSAMQVAFLGEKTISAVLGYDLSQKKERKIFICDLIMQLTKKPESRQF